MPAPTDGPTPDSLPTGGETGSISADGGLTQPEWFHGRRDEKNPASSRRSGAHVDAGGLRTTAEPPTARALAAKIPGCTGMTIGTPTVMEIQDVTCNLSDGAPVEIGAFANSRDELALLTGSCEPTRNQDAGVRWRRANGRPHISPCSARTGPESE